MSVKLDTLEEGQRVHVREGARCVDGSPSFGIEGSVAKVREVVGGATALVVYHADDEPMEGPCEWLHVADLDAGGNR